MWKKLGKIFCPSENGLLSHAQAPTVLVCENAIKVFFSSRNSLGKTFPYMAIFDKLNPNKLISFEAKPILELGEPGCFDMDGVMPSSVLTVENKVFMYYTGWEQRKTTPYHNSIGLAVSKDGGETFTKVGFGPIVDRCYSEPYIAITPDVHFDGEQFVMWYSSGTKWILQNDKYEPVYVIKKATSKNGIDWCRAPKILLEPCYENEVTVSPSVQIENGSYRMWFCHRQPLNYRQGNGGYQIAFAESSDGENWTRSQQPIFDDQVTSWDEQMTCYPATFSVNGKLYMIYNGNNFGQNGFGLAVMEPN